MIIRGSAHKHGIRDEDALAAATWPAVTVALDGENPQRLLHIGFDTQGRLLETVVLVWDDGPAS